MLVLWKHESYPGVTITNSNMEPFVQYGFGCKYFWFLLRRSIRHNNKNNQHKISLIFCNFLRKSEEREYKFFQLSILLISIDESKMKGYFLYFSCFIFPCFH